MAEETVIDAMERMESAENELIEEYSATTAEVRPDDTVHLEFHGFNTLEDAVERVSEVALEASEYGDVHVGANSAGGYRSDIGEEDPRPMGWVNVSVDDLEE